MNSNPQNNPAVRCMLNTKYKTTMCRYYEAGTTDNNKKLLNLTFNFCFPVKLNEKNVNSFFKIKSALWEIDAISLMEKKI